MKILNVATCQMSLLLFVVSAPSYTCALFNIALGLDIFKQGPNLTLLLFWFLKRSAPQTECQVEA